MTRSTPKHKRNISSQSGRQARSKQHVLPEDEIAYELPDDFYALSPEERAARGMATDDLCVLDGRCFVRGVLPIPVPAQGREYCWGLWVEVSPEAFRRYIEIYSDPEQAEEPPLSGRVANGLAGYEPTIGLSVSLTLTGKTTRPRIKIGEQRHQLAQEQHRGVSPQRVLEFLSPYLCPADIGPSTPQESPPPTTPRGKQPKRKASKPRASRRACSPQ